MLSPLNLYFSTLFHPEIKENNPNVAGVLYALTGALAAGVEKQMADHLLPFIKDLKKNPVLLIPGSLNEGMAYQFRLSGSSSNLSGTPSPSVSLKKSISFSSVKDTCPKG